VTSRVWLALSVAGFVASALLHLGTFTPLVAWLGDAGVAVLFGAAFVPLVAMIVRLRRAAEPTRRWRGLHLYDWRLVAALVPPPVRGLVFATAMYVLMNLVLSLIVVGGVSVAVTEVHGTRTYHAIEGTERREVSRAEYEMHRAAVLRLSSGHLLLFYLVPMVYFAFVDPRRPELVPDR
jgi:hypothetical protein